MKMSVQEELDATCLEVTKQKARVVLAEKKLSALYKQQKILDDMRFDQCKHDRCEVVRSSNYWQDEYGSGHTDYYLYVKCNACERTLAESTHNYRNGVGDGVSLSGTILQVAPYWYRYRGSEVRGKPYNLPGVREVTKMERQYVSVPVKEYVR